MALTALSCWVPTTALLGSASGQRELHAYVQLQLAQKVVALITSAVRFLIY
jgi:hypothetical protein